MITSGNVIQQTPAAGVIFTGCSLHRRRGQARTGARAQAQSGEIERQPAARD